MQAWCSPVVSYRFMQRGHMSTSPVPECKRNDGRKSLGIAKWPTSCRPISMALDEPQHVNYAQRGDSQADLAIR